MPIYSLYCPEHHKTDRYAPIAKMPRWCKCETCGGRAKLGMPGSLSDGFVKNRPMSRQSKECYRWAFGKKKAAQMQTTADVDRALDDFTRRYPHLAPGYKRGKSYDLNSASDMAELGRPGDRMKDPFPDAKITDEKRNNWRER